MSLRLLQVRHLVQGYYWYQKARSEERAYGLPSLPSIIPLGIFGSGSAAVLAVVDGSLSLLSSAIAIMGRRKNGQRLESLSP